MDKTEVKVSCPNCGTELNVSMQKTTIVGVSPQPKCSANERLNALKKAGVDVTNLFAMQMATGEEHVVRRNIDGLSFSIVCEDDEIFKHIIDAGSIPNRKLFRRWVMSQVFHVMSCSRYSFTENIHALGYEYQWRMVLDELYAQMKMSLHNDKNALAERNRWFNQFIIIAMIEDYVEKLKDYVEKLPEKHCKGVPYKTIAGKHYFVSDLTKKLYDKYLFFVLEAKVTTTPKQLYEVVKRFNDQRIKLRYAKQCKEWVDAYKGAGAYFTLQNMIRFHNCYIYNNDKKLSKTESLVYIDGKAEEYCNGEGWRMFGVLKKCLEDNHIDINRKINEWRSR